MCQSLLPRLCFLTGLLGFVGGERGLPGGKKGTGARIPEGDSGEKSEALGASSEKSERPDGGEG